MTDTNLAATIDAAWEAGKLVEAPILAVATTREGSGVILVKEQPPSEGSEAINPADSTPVGAEQLLFRGGNGGGSNSPMNTS